MSNGGASTLFVLSALFFSAPCFLGCGSRPELDARPGSGDDPQGDPATAGTGGGSATGGGAPPTCTATCTTPAGPLYTFSSTEDANRLIVGRWEICSALGVVFPRRPPDAIGIEFERVARSGMIQGGNVYYLVASADGVTRGKGFDYQISYDLGVHAGVGLLRLYRLTSGEGEQGGGPLLYSPCPGHIEMGVLAHGIYGTIAAL